MVYSILITQFVSIIQVSIDYLARESSTNAYLPVAEFWVVRRDRPGGASSTRNYSRRSKSILQNSAACLTCFDFNIFNLAQHLINDIYFTPNVSCGFRLDMK